MIATVDQICHKPLNAVLTNSLLENIIANYKQYLILKWQSNINSELYFLWSIKYPKYNLGCYNIDTKKLIMFSHSQGEYCYTFTYTDSINTNKYFEKIINKILLRSEIKIKL